MSLNAASPTGIPGSDVEWIAQSAEYMFPAPPPPARRAQAALYDVELGALVRAERRLERALDSFAYVNRLKPRVVRDALEYVTAVENPVRKSLAAVTWFEVPDFVDEKHREDFERECQLVEEAGRVSVCPEHLRPLLYEPSGEPTSLYMGLVDLEQRNRSERFQEIRAAEEAVREERKAWLREENARHERGLTLAGLMDLDPPDWLIEPYLLKGTVAQLTGPSGSYKTFMAVDIALRLARTHRDVLYIAGEGVAGLGERATAWQAHHGALDPSAQARFHVIGQAVNLLDTNAVHDLCDWIERAGGFHLVVVDTLARAMPGADENSAEAMTAAVEAVDRIRRAAGPEATVLLVHHMGWDGKRQRGSSALYGANDTVMYLIPQAGGRVKLSVDKQKDRPEAAPVHLELVPVAGSRSCVLTRSVRPPESQDLLAAIVGHLEAIPEGSTPRAIANALDADYEAVKKALQRAAEGANGAVVRIGRGVYTLRSATG